VVAKIAPIDESVFDRLEQELGLKGVGISEARLYDASADSFPEPEGVPMTMRRKLFGISGAMVLLSGLGVALAQKEYKNGVVWPEPAVVTPAAVDKPGAPPSDATVLFDGTAETFQKYFKNAEKWELKDGYAVVKGADVVTTESYGDMQLHVEFATPEQVDPKQTGQGRGNSGVYIMGRYEVQILDSFENKTYFDGQCASLYKQQPPMVNVCRKPGEWQTYDIAFEAPMFDTAGKVVKPAIITVLQNGVFVQNHYELKGGTYYDQPAKYEKHEEKAPFRLQNHGNPLKFRNIWVREFKPLVGVPPMSKKDDK
jgi:hypothetical protein